MRKPLACVVVGVLALGLGGATGAAAQGMPPLPKPGPEHAIYKDIEGTWDAKVESFQAPGPPSVSTGVEVDRLSCGGLCLVTDFKSSFMNTPFEGHGTETWDVAKKKYVGSWMDSMVSGMYVTEGTYDAARKTMTSWMEGPDMTGKVTKTKSTSVMKGPATRVFSMFNVGPDGKEALGMRITYTKRK